MILTLLLSTLKLLITGILSLLFLILKIIVMRLKFLWNAGNLEVFVNVINILCLYLIQNAQRHVKAYKEFLNLEFLQN